MYIVYGGYLDSNMRQDTIQLFWLQQVFVRLYLLIGYCYNNLGRGIKSQATPECPAGMLPDSSMVERAAVNR
jgi:hypothetical protein